MISAGIRKTLFFFICICFVLLAVSACADELNVLRPEKAVQVNRETLGVGKGTTLPVYSAPFEDAWRGAAGRAAVSSSEPFGILTTAQQGEWLLISYRVDEKSSRIGWIRRPEPMEAREDIPLLYMSRALYRVTKNTILTDDPLGSRRIVTRLQQGDEIIAMLRLETDDGEWLYAETTVDGRPAWGFLDVFAAESVDPYHLEGDTLVFREGVTSLGMREDDVIRPGDLWCPCIYLYDDFGDRLRRVSFPASLRCLGAEAFLSPHLEEITLPGTLTFVSDDALYGGKIGKVILEKDYTAGIIGGTYAVFNAWQVEAGNPVYSSRDGVLFSADGKTFLRYPNGSGRQHYDVPAGTEEIAGFAFYDQLQDIPLQTVSLPIGLKRIGAYAFCGCGRLHSLTVPLTVTELSGDAFAYCVSLERLSLPPGLSAMFDDAYALGEDFSRFNGDNGATRLFPLDEFGKRADDIADRWAEIWISGSNGEGLVNVYPSPDSDQVISQIYSGTGEGMSRVSGNRVCIGLYKGSEEWVDISDILPRGRDVFFELYDAVPTAEGLETLAKEQMADYRFSLYEESDWEAGFSMEPPDTWGRDSAVYLPITQLKLYRHPTGDNRIFGLLYAPEQETPVRIFDKPDGTPITWTYRSDQAEILARENGWIRIRTGFASGWVRSEHVIIVDPFPSENQ